MAGCTVHWVPTKLNSDRKWIHPGEKSLFMAMTTNQDYGNISALITIDKDVFIYTETIS